MFIDIPVTSCLCERSFSKLIQVKFQVEPQRVKKIEQTFAYIEQELAINTDTDIAMILKNLVDFIRQMK